MLVFNLPKKYLCWVALSVNPRTISPTTGICITLESNGKNSCSSLGESPCSEKTYLPSIAPGPDKFGSTSCGPTISSSSGLASTILKVSITSTASNS